MFKSFGYCIAVVMLLTYPQMVNADPGATVNKFMDTPVSLFSLGLDKLCNRAQTIASSPIFTVGGVYGSSYSSGCTTFDWDTSRITLFISRFTGANEEPQRLEEECATSIKTLRSMAFIPADGKLAKDVMSDFALNFYPTGYSIKKFSVDDGKAIDAMITLKVQIYNFAKSSNLVCTAPLLGTGYSIEK